jgi:protease-4
VSQYLTTPNILLALIVFVVLAKILKKAKKERKGIDVQVVSINSIIRYDDDDDSDFKQLTERLKTVEKREPKALVMRINSPGGTIGASQDLYAKVKRLREKGIFVVAVMEDVAASGGLYLSMAANYIIAHGGTITGSIGVIIKGWDISKILDRFEITTNTIKSGPYKDVFSPTRPMQDEERKFLGDMINDGYDQFCETIADARNLECDCVKKIADGRVLSGNQALQHGLIDGLGSFESALDVISTKLNIDRDKLEVEEVRPHRSLAAKVKHAITSSRFGASLMNAMPDQGLTGIPLWLMKK